MSSKELYVGNLDPVTKSQELREIFERYGNVSRCEVKVGSSAYSAAFGFVGFDSSEDAERAQRKEHGSNHRGRRLIVEFTKTTAGQNGKRDRYIGGGVERGDNGRNRSRSRERYQRRRRSPSYNRRSSRDRSHSGDNRRRKGDRSRSPPVQDSKRYRGSPTDEKRRSSRSRTNGNSKKY